MCCVALHCIVLHCVVLYFVLFCALKKIDIFHSVEIFWKSCRERLENSLSIVQFHGMEI